MDKFAYWTLKVLTYLFLISAIVCLIAWIVEDKDSYGHQASCVIWLSLILSSLFLSAASHVLCRIMGNYYTPSKIVLGESDDFESEDTEE